MIKLIKLQFTLFFIGLVTFQSPNFQEELNNWALESFQSLVNMEK